MKRYIVDEYGIVARPPGDELVLASEVEPLLREARGELVNMLSMLDGDVEEGDPLPDLITRINEAIGENDE